MSDNHFISLVIFDQMDLETLEWKLNNRKISTFLCLSENIGNLTNVSILEEILIFKGTLGEITIELKNSDIQKLVLELKKTRGV